MAAAVIGTVVVLGLLAGFAYAVVGGRHATVRSPAAASPSVAPTGGAPSTAGRAAGPSPSPLATPSPIPGYLMIADAGNHRMLLVDGAKHVLWRYPKPGATPSFPLGYDDDVFFGPEHDVVITNQERQHTVEVVSFPGGKVLWHYGHVDVPGSSAGYLNTPDDAYLLPDGTRTVADIRNCRILFLSEAGTIERQYGTTGFCAHAPPRTFASPNGDTPLPGGGMLVTEIGGSWIDRLDADGNLLWSVHAPIAYPSDAQLLPNGQILLADYSTPGHVLIMTRSGRVVWEYGTGLSGDAALDHPSLAVELPNGLIAVNDDYRHRVVLIDRASARIVWQYGHTGVAGTADGYLNTPDGLDFLPFDIATTNAAIRTVVLGTRG